MKKALILAAGIGKRLRELTRDIPKCLLQIDQDNVLIDFSLLALKEANIEEVIFITGFAEDKLKEYINKKWKNQFDFKFIFNNKYAQYNNIYSAFLAKDIWDDETILLNSDIIFHSSILKNLKPEESRDVVNHVSTSFLVIDDKKKLDKEDMKVTLDEYGQITKINKNLDIETSFGEYIGITYLRGLERVKFLESIENNIKNQKFDLYYEDALAEVLNVISVLPCSTQGLPWTEVDTIENYEIAKVIAKDIKARVAI